MNYKTTELDDRVTALEKKMESVAKQVDSTKTELATIIGLCTEIKLAIAAKQKWSLFSW
jgi:hypothetical protein